MIGSNRQNVTADKIFFQKICIDSLRNMIYFVHKTLFNIFSF